MSTPSIASNAVCDAAGAPAAVRAHVPTCPGRLHCASGSPQALSQQTSSAQNVDPQCSGAAQLAPLSCGVGVTVGASVGVLVGQLAKFPDPQVESGPHADSI